MSQQNRLDKQSQANHTCSGHIFVVRAFSAAPTRSIRPVVAEPSRLPSNILRKLLSKRKCYRKSLVFGGGSLVNAGIHAVELQRSDMQALGKACKRLLLQKPRGSTTAAISL